MLLGPASHPPRMVNYLRLAQSLNNSTVKITDQYPKHAAQHGSTHSNGRVDEKFAVVASGASEHCPGV